MHGAGAGRLRPSPCRAENPGNTGGNDREIPEIEARELLAKARVVFGRLPDAMPGSRHDSDAMVALGEKLYREKALSFRRDESCYTCHPIDGKRAAPAIRRLPRRRTAHPSFGTRLRSSTPASKRPNFGTAARPTCWNKPGCRCSTLWKWPCPMKRSASSGSASCRMRQCSATRFPRRTRSPWRTRFGRLPPSSTRSFPAGGATTT